MNRWIAWAASHRAAVGAGAAVYFVVNVLTHENVQAVALDIIDRLTIRGANFAVLAAGAVVALAALPWFVLRLRRGPLAAVRAFYVVSTAVLVLAAGPWLFAINSESIHFVQYGLLAVLVFPLVGRAGETIMLVTILGAFDEGFQYWVLHLHWGVYYDFNDVVLNLLGAAIGVTIVIVAADSDAVAARPADYSIRRLLQSGALRSLAVLGIVCAGLLLSGLLTIDPDETAWAVLRRSGPPESFWVQPDWGRSYHVLSPLEGVLATLILMGFYLPLDFAARWVPAEADERRMQVPLAGLSPGRPGVADEDRLPNA